MNSVTGMGTGTAIHYNNVAAQMHSYANFPGHHSPSPYPGQFGRGGGGQVLYYGAQRLGVHPMVVNEIGGIARGFMRNVLS